MWSGGEGPFWEKEISGTKTLCKEGHELFKEQEEDKHGQTLMNKQNMELLCDTR